MARNFTEHTAVARGLDELVRDMGRLGSTFKKELQTGLREIAEDVKGEAVQQAVRQGLVDTGNTIRHIKTRVRGGKAFVIEDATDATRPNAGPGQHGYPYPRIYEFKDDGRRSFMRRALEVKARAVQTGVERILDRATKETNL